MSSIIEGYENDIFISYRQKDNKGDKWVTEFVENLKEELEATFKEEISVYFDINPHDGILETHDVNASLKDKLKCLIFIPILSRTYCDPRSYAWENEFKTFVQQASEDQFGLKIKLPNGNVANRILPVRIYDLEDSDIRLCESVLDGVIRGVEFIYKEPGVNRPLRAMEENPHDNLNHTIYRNQINKVANAIKEVITAIGEHEQKSEVIISKVFKSVPATKKNLPKRVIAGFLVFMTLTVMLYFLAPAILRSAKPPEKSIAVLPFINDTPVDSNKYFINGIMDEILNNLQSIKDLRVISRTSVEQYRNTSKSIPEIAKELGVNYIVEGSGQKYGNSFSLSVQLIRATTRENHLWAKSFEQEIKDIKDIFSIKKQIAKAIASELKAVITPQEEDLIRQIPTNNTLAYDYYLKGKQYMSDLRYKPAINMYNKAIKQDTGFALALLSRSHIYSRIYFSRGSEYNYAGDWKGFDKLAKEDLAKALKMSPDMPELKYSQAEQLYRFERKHEKALLILDEVENQMPNNPSVFFLRSIILRRMGKWEESVREMKRKILLDPLNADGYIEIAHTYRLMRKYPEALEYFNKSLLLDQNPENRNGKFITILNWTGNLDSALKAYESDAAVPDWIDIYYNRHFDRLLSDTIRFGSYEDQFSYYPAALRQAQAYFLNSNIALCSGYADSAINELMVRVKDSPEDERYYAALGYAWAYKGDNKKAIEYAQKAIKLKPLKLDAWQGYYKELDLVKICILCREYDLALDKIEYLLKIPGDLTIPILKIDPWYDRMRSLPRFQKILATEYKTRL